MSDDAPRPAPVDAAPPAPSLTDPLPVARLRRSRSGGWIWIVPVAALAVVAGLVLREWLRRGPLIEVEVPRASGIEAGRTPVLSQGVPIGRVDRVRLDPTLTRPVLDVRLESWAGDFARDGAAYWVVRPSINFHGVSGLETLTSGPVIEARPAPSDAGRATRFVASAQAPSEGVSDSGLHVTLATDRLGSVRPGSPVTYRDIEVGEVVEARLATDARKVLLEILIHERFAPLVRDGSRFWSTSGFGVDLGITGLKLRTESLESMLGGGVAFATPSADAPLARAGATFELATEPEKEWLRWAPAIELAQP